MRLVSDSDSVIVKGPLAGRPVLTAFSVLSSNCCWVILAKSATLSCGKNWHKFPTCMLNFATCSSTCNNNREFRKLNCTYIKRFFKPSRCVSWQLQKCTLQKWVIFFLRKETLLIDIKCLKGFGYFEYHLQRAHFLWIKLLIVSGTQCSKISHDLGMESLTLTVG